MTDIRKLTDDEVRATPARLKSVDEIKAEFVSAREYDQRLQGRWLIGLAVANGGALTALSAKLLDVLGQPDTMEARAAVALALPSLWLFIVGFVAVGLAALAELLRNQQAVREAHRSLRIRAHYPESVTHDGLGDNPILSWAVELTSAGCFVAGLIYPVAVLGVRYFQVGGVAW